MLVENEISCTILPSVPDGTECVTGNIVPISLFYPHSVPNGTGGRMRTRIFYQHVVPNGTEAAFSSEHDWAMPCASDYRAFSPFPDSYAATGFKDVAALLPLLARYICQFDRSDKRRNGNKDGGYYFVMGSENLNRKFD
jgi:hypothetical protein